MTEPDAVLSADLGGTAIGAGLVTEDGEVRLATEVPTFAGGPGTVVETLLALLSRLKDEAAVAGLRLVGCGLGVPGAVDRGTGRIGEDVQNVPELAGCPLAERAAARIGLPVCVDNDVNALTLSEVRFGVARGLRSFVLLAIGTGVGAGVYVHHDLLRGASGYGGELGHVTVKLDGRPCFCGSRGCLKAYVAGPEIAAQAREALPAHPNSRLAVPAGAGSGIGARDVFDAARQGDALAGAIVEHVCRVLGAALGGILNGLNPEAVVLTGGVAGSLAPHLGRVLDWTRAYSFPGAFAAARIEVLPMTKAGAIRGAAALFLHEAERAGQGSAPALDGPRGQQ